MLVGRESLSRLVGKRRFFIHPPSLWPGSDSSTKEYNTPSAGVTPESSSKDKKNPPQLVKSEGTPDASTKHKWISCPVCGVSLRDDDIMINDHLDTCLAKGTKRKLRQRTLAELNFCTWTTNGVESDGIYDSCVNVFQNSPGNLHAQNIVETLSNNVVRTEENLNCPRPYMESIEHSNIAQGFSPISGYPALKSEQSLQSFECEKANVSVDLLIKDICETSLQTFIVGHRYTKSVANSGDSIFLEREPSNIKDSNAIKVLSLNTGSNALLGYIPRELACYLSPLLDKYGTRLEGYITYISEELDVIPIQLSFLIQISNISDGYGNLGVLEHLWKNVVAVAESMKTTHGACKYLKNFVLLVQETLRSYAYLLTDDEQIFLDMFEHLSGDSQKLFVRLYSRKGPWFRLSNMNYPEILDLQMATQELIEHDFLLSYESDPNPTVHDIESILNVFSIAELREISNVLRKKCIHGMKKHDIIISLLSSCRDNLHSSSFNS